MVLLAALLAGCKSNPTITPAAGEAMSMLAVRQIKIQPFTKIKSFDDDKIPDGIAVVVQPTDQFGDPVKAVGHLYFELYAYQAASGERKGQRLEFWDRTIATPADMKLYWDRTAQMYQFPLAWTQGVPAVPSRKLILTVTYRTPWDLTLTDELIMDVPVAKPPAQAAGAAAQ